MADDKERVVRETVNNKTNNHCLDNKQLKTTAALEKWAETIFLIHLILMSSCVPRKSSFESDPTSLFAFHFHGKRLGGRLAAKVRTAMREIIKLYLLAASAFGPKFEAKRTEKNCDGKSFQSTINNKTNCLFIRNASQTNSNSQWHEIRVLSRSVPDTRVIRSRGIPPPEKEREHPTGGEEESKHELPSQLLPLSALHRWLQPESILFEGIIIKLKLRGVKLICVVHQMALLPTT